MHHPAPPPVGPLVALYRRVLALYPPIFRASFSGEMIFIFRELCGTAYLEAGRGGLFRAATRMGADLLFSATQQHLLNEEAMSPQSLRQSAVALIVGALLAFLVVPAVALGLTTFSNSVAITMLVALAMPVALLLGLRGVRASRVLGDGALPQALLAVAALTLCAHLVAVVLRVVIGEDMWVLYTFSYMAFMLIGCFLGASALATRRLPPLAGGALMLGGLLWGGVWLYSLLVPIEEMGTSVVNIGIGVGLAAAALGWVTIGYQLWTNPSPRSPTPPAALA